MPSRKPFPPEEVAREKQEFLRDHSTELKQLVRRYLSATVPEYIIDGREREPKEASLMQIVNGFKSTVQTKFGTTYSLFRQLCTEEVDALINRTLAFLAAIYSSPGRQSQFSYRPLKWVLEEIKGHLSQATRETLLQYSVGIRL